MNGHACRRRVMAMLLGSAAAWIGVGRAAGGATPFPVGPLDPVPAIRQRAEWTRFAILVWQYKTDVRQDKALYERAGIHGFHIDRGWKKDALVEFSRRNQWPYYVDHAADKGYLYLKRSVQSAISRKKHLQVRPRSLAVPATIAAMKEHLRRNVGTTKRGLVYAYAFDDEISLGAFNNPVEVDTHPRSLAWYRAWLKTRYRTIRALNAEWATHYRTFDAVQPTSFEDVRRGATKPPIARWNLCRWMEWRQFMNYQFASVLADLTRYTNSLDGRIMAGFVGGQQPAPYGGYDYALLTRAVQWMEAYDIGATNEILRSWWNRPRRVRMHTYGAGKDAKRDAWLLWYRLAHGDQANIVWPAGWFVTDKRSGRRALNPNVKRLASVFKEVQGRASEFITSPDAHLDADPIGIYYSQPSIHASWAMDVITHKGTWPNRSSSLDNKNQSKGQLRVAWCKLLEDLGYQVDFTSYLDVEEGRIDLAKRFKVIILPKTICLSDTEAEALRRFVRDGGTLVADYLCGLMTGHGRGRATGALDDLFDIVRDESKGYMNGQGLSEIDGERYKRPLPERLRFYDGALRRGEMIIFERGTRRRAAHGSVPAGASGGGEPAVNPRQPGAHAPGSPRSAGKGHAIYLNATPLGYVHFPWRQGALGRQWRETLGRILKQAGLRPRVEVSENGSREHFIESLLWKKGRQYCLALVKNGAYQAGIAGFAGMRVSGIGSKPTEIDVRLTGIPVTHIVNMRTGESLGPGPAFHDTLKPWEANLYLVE